MATSPPRIDIECIANRPRSVAQRLEDPPLGKSSAVNPADLMGLTTSSVPAHWSSGAVDSLQRWPPRLQGKCPVPAFVRRASGGFWRASGGLLAICGNGVLGPRSRLVVENFYVVGWELSRPSIS